MLWVPFLSIFLEILRLSAKIQFSSSSVLPFPLYWIISTWKYVQFISLLYIICSEYYYVSYVNSSFSIYLYIVLFHLLCQTSLNNQPYQLSLFLKSFPTYALVHFSLTFVPITLPKGIICRLLFLKPFFLWLLQHILLFFFLSGFLASLLSWSFPDCSLNIDVRKCYLLFSRSFFFPLPLHFSWFSSLSLNSDNSQIFFLSNLSSKV